MADDLGTVVVGFGTDTSQLEAGLARAVSGLNAFGAAIEAQNQKVQAQKKATEEARGPLDQLGLSLERLLHTGLEPLATIAPTFANGLEGILTSAGPAALAIGALSAGVVALGVGLADIASSVAASDAEIAHLAERFEITTAQVSGLKLAAEESGQSVEAFGQTFRFLERAIGEAAQGSAKQVELFDRLHLSLGELLAQSPAERFETVVRAILNLDDASDRAAIATQVLGRHYQSLIPVLQAVAKDGIGGLVARAQDLGAVVGEQAAAAAKRYEAAVADLGAAFGGLKRALGEDLIPKLTVVVRLLGAFFAPPKNIQDILGDIRGIIDELHDFEKAHTDAAATAGRAFDELEQKIRASTQAYLRDVVGLTDELARHFADLEPAQQKVVVSTNLAAQAAERERDVAVNAAQAIVGSIGQVAAKREADYQKRLQEIETALNAEIEAIRKSSLAANKKIDGVAAAESLITRAQQAALNERAAADATYNDQRLKAARETAAALADAEFKVAQTALDANSKVTASSLTLEATRKRIAGDEAGAAAADADRQLLDVQASLDRQVAATQNALRKEEASIAEKYGKTAEGAKLEADANKAAQITIVGYEQDAANKRQDIEAKRLEKLRQDENRRLQEQLQRFTQEIQAQNQLIQADAALVTNKLKGDNDVAQADASLQAAQLRAIGDETEARRTEIEARIAGLREAAAVEQADAQSRIQQLNNELTILAEQLKVQQAIAASAAAGSPEQKNAQSQILVIEQKIKATQDGIAQAQDTITASAQKTAAAIQEQELAEEQLFASTSKTLDVTKQMEAVSAQMAADLQKIADIQAQSARNFEQASKQTAAAQQALGDFLRKQQEAAQVAATQDAAARQALQQRFAAQEAEIAQQRQLLQLQQAVTDAQQAENQVIFDRARAVAQVAQASSAAASQRIAQATSSFAPLPGETPIGFARGLEVGPVPVAKPGAIGFPEPVLRYARGLNIPAPAGATPAYLHPDEEVVNPAQRSRILAALERAEAAGGTSPGITINAPTTVHVGITGPVAEQSLQQLDTALRDIALKNGSRLVQEIRRQLGQYGVGYGS